MSLTFEQLEEIRSKRNKTIEELKRERALRLQNYSVMYSFFAASFAAVVELALMYPSHFIKTYCQYTHPSSRVIVQVRPLKATAEYMRDRGILGFYLGFKPLMVASILRAFFRMGAYDIASKQSDPEYKRKYMRLYALTVGFTEAVITLPFDNLRGHMVHTAWTRKVESELTTITRVMAKYGFRSLWAGFFPTMWIHSLQYSIRFITMTSLFEMFDTWAYPRAQRVYNQYMSELQRPENEHVLSNYKMEEFSYNRPEMATTAIATFATVGSTFLTMPLDTIRTKMQSPERASYRGFLHCLTSTVQKDGTKALWRGTTPRLIRSLCATPIILWAYEVCLDWFETTGPDPITSVGRVDI